MKPSPVLSSLLILLGGLSPASAPGSTLRVALRNGTAGATLPAETLVRLDVLQDGREVSEQSARADDRGEAVFSGLPSGAGYSFQVVAEYAGVNYSSEPVSFPVGESEKSVEVLVYEPTTDASRLSVTMAHLFFKPAGRDLVVQEMLFVSNGSDRNYIGKSVDGGASRETLRLTLPRGASDIELGRGLMSCCINVRDNVIVDSMEVPPGTKEIGFSYRLSSTESTLDFERFLDLPVRQAVLVAQDVAVESMTESLARVAMARGGEGAAGAGGSPVALAGMDLPAGEALKVRLSGLPEPSRASGTLAPILAVIGGGAVLLIALGLVSRRGKRPPSGEGVSLEAITEKIARLDMQLEAGELDPASHEKERAILKRKLVLLLEYGERP